MSVTIYKAGGTNLSDICNTANHSYYGDISSNYNQNGIDVGTVLSLQTFSPAPNSITACNYRANIIQYNTGAVWNGPATFTGGGTATKIWVSISISSNGQNAIACSYPGRIYYSSNFGRDWTEASTPTSDNPWLAVSISSSGQYAIACTDNLLNSGYLYYSIDNGVNWTLSNPPINSEWTSVSISSSGQYAIACAITGAGVGGIIVYSSNYGQNWTASNAPSAGWNSVSISSSGQYAIAGPISNIASIYYSGDYGHTWLPSNSPTGNSWYVSISSSGQYAVGALYSPNGRIYWSDNYGKTWSGATFTSSGSPATGFWSSVSISSTGQYAVASISGNSGGQIYWSIDKGQTWTVSNSGTNIWTSVSISSNGQYALACYSNLLDGTPGDIYYSSNTNTSTTYVNKDLTEVFEPLYKYKTWDATGSGTGDWQGVSISDSGQFAVAANNGSKIYWSDDSGLTWNLSSTADNNWFDISISSSGQYALAASGPQPDSIYYSSDKGQNWLPSTLLNHPSSMYIKSVSISGNGQYGIAGDKNVGKIYHSNDKGQTWNQANSQTMDWYSVSMSDTGQYALACSQVYTTGKQIYWSANYGADWSGPATFVGGGVLIQIWESISISSSGQYAFACSGGVGGIYWSNDYGHNWTKVNNLPGLSFYSISISSTGQYGVALIGFVNQLYYSSNYGVTWVLASTIKQDWKSASISGNGQYALICSPDPLGQTTIYRCLAQN